MRWFAFAIFAYIAVGLQTGIDSFIRFEASGTVLAELNLVLVAVVFVCIYAPRRDALLASLILGAMQDMVTQQTFGLFAFGYGLVALLITSLVSAVHRSHPLTHFTFAFLGGVVVAMVIIVHGWIHPDASAIARQGIMIQPAHEAAGLYFGSMVYTAIIAPFFIAVLQRIKRLFGFQNLRPRLGAR